MFSRDNPWRFRVMTYNIRMDTSADGLNRWNLRKQRVFDLIRYHQPDLFGVQEAFPNQLADIRAALPSYDWYGVGRDDGKDQGEFSAIFYRPNIFQLRAKGTFWLSQTPDVPGSKGWDAALPRICSWVKLEDRRNGQSIYHFNTHLDHVGQIARRESDQLILNRIQMLTGLITPSILTGDFNVGPQSDPYRILVNNAFLQDAKRTTKSPHQGPSGTWSTFNVRHRIGQRLDYIFPSSQHFDVLTHQHSTFSENSYYPSDHLPVLADLVLKRSTSTNDRLRYYRSPLRWFYSS